MEQPKRTNEELAILAQNGDPSAAGQLWEQNRPLLGMMLWRLYDLYRERATAAGVTWEDVEQIGYFCILRALKSYNPAAGKFSTYLEYAVKTQFYGLVGMRTEKQYKEPLNHAGSLDEPRGEEEDLFLADIIPDPAAAAALEAVDEDLFREKLRDDLNGALEGLPERSADIVRGHYLEGETFIALGEKYGISARHACQVKDNALQALRRASQLQAYAAEMTAARAYHGTGWSAWADRGSVPERLIEWREALFSGKIRPL